MKHYVLGLAFDEALESVVLIEKKRPEWMAGKWNGVGGKVEEGEVPLDAMVREFREETGVETKREAWDEFLLMEDEGATQFAIHVFKLRSADVVEAVLSMTDEPVSLWDFKAMTEIWYGHYSTSDDTFMPNLKWILPLAKDWRPGQSPSKIVVLYPPDSQ